MATRKPMVFQSNHQTGYELKLYFHDDGSVQFETEDDYGTPGFFLTPEQTRDLGVILDVHARNGMIEEG